MECEPAGRDERLHARDRRRLRAKLRAAVHQRDAARLAAELEHPVERAVAAARDQHVLAVEVFGAPHAIEQLRAFVALRVGHQEPPRLERAEAARDDEAAGVEARAGRRLDGEATGRLSRDRGDFLAEVKPGVERLDLLEQAVDEFLRAAHRQRRDVVDRLVGIELGALPAGMRERVDDLALHAEQAELEHGEEADRAGADDHAFGLDGGWRPRLRSRSGSGEGRAARAARAGILTDDRLDHGPRPGNAPRPAGARLSHARRARRSRSRSRPSSRPRVRPTARPARRC